MSEQERALLYWIQGPEEQPDGERAITDEHYALAVHMAGRSGPNHPEKLAGLRKLLEALECFKRAEQWPRGLPPERYGEHA